MRYWYKFNRSLLYPGKDTIQATIRHNTRVWKLTQRITMQKHHKIQNLFYTAKDPKKDTLQTLWYTRSQDSTNKIVLNVILDLIKNIDLSMEWKLNMMALRLFQIV